jgi:hypothetical protein
MAMTSFSPFGGLHYLDTERRVPGAAVERSGTAVACTPQFGEERVCNFALAHRPPLLVIL